MLTIVVLWVLPTCIVHPGTKVFTIHVVTICIGVVGVLSVSLDVALSATVSVSWLAITIAVGVVHVVAHSRSVSVRISISVGVLTEICFSIGCAVVKLATGGTAIGTVGSGVVHATVARG